MDKSAQIDTFSRFTRVSRETITSLMLYEKMLIKANKSLNLIGNSTINQIWTRHFLDSSQVIDFIDKNKRDLVDIGTGAGFPGLVIAILARDRKIGLKVRLIEKSRKKVSFLEGIIKNLKLDVDVLNQNVLDQTTKLKADLIIARAFKPLKIVLDFLDKNTENWKEAENVFSQPGQGASHKNCIYFPESADFFPDIFRYPGGHKWVPGPRLVMKYFSESF